MERSSKAMKKNMLSSLIFISLFGMPALAYAQVASSDRPTATLNPMMLPVSTFPVERLYFKSVDQSLFCPSDVAHPSPSSLPLCYASIDGHSGRPTLAVPACDPFDIAVGGELHRDISVSPPVW
jgi:hypothetical protein